MTSWSPQSSKEDQLQEVNRMNQQVWWRGHKREDICFIPDDPKGLSEEIILKLNGEKESSGKTAYYSPSHPGYVMQQSIL